MNAVYGMYIQVRTLLVVEKDWQMMNRVTIAIEERVRPLRVWLRSDWWVTLL